MTVVQTFAALADPVRSAIVDRLTAGDATVGELAALFPITLQAVSQQVGTLERAGLVTRHRQGRARRVHLEASQIEQAARWLEARRLRLEERYRRLDGVLAELVTGRPDGDRQDTTGDAGAATTASPIGKDTP
jgi:DNA-binding transcriptional ArsR family regulator